MLPFLARRWFLICLAAVLAVSFAFPQTLKPVMERVPRNFVVGAVLFLMALPLDVRAIFATLRRPAASLLAIFVSVVAAPLLAWTASPLVPPQLAGGLIVAGTLPSTLASAAVWTRRAGGNDAVSLLVTLLTNLGCFAVMPFWLSLMAGQAVQTGKSLDAAAMVRELLLVAAIPVVAAQLWRLVGGVGKFATEHKIPLSVLCQVGILTMVFTGSVRSGVELDETARTLKESTVAQSSRAAGNSGGTSAPMSPRPALPGALGWAGMFAAVVLIHAALFFGGYCAGSVLGIARADRIAVAFSGSQKTLVIGIKVATENVHLFGALAIVPLVAYHVSQLVVDTFFADWLKARGQKPAVGQQPHTA
ncbi:MAG: bile acid:sodium symporter [Planctomycetia bacterium]|nr:bile acid:sodium symporter [Planctomycetia bacterium]